MRHEHNAMVKMVNRLRRRGIVAAIHRDPPIVPSNRYMLTIHTEDCPGGQYVMLTPKSANVWQMWIPTTSRRLPERPAWGTKPYAWHFGSWQLFKNMTAAEVEEWLS